MVERSISPKITIQLLAGRPAPGLDWLWTSDGRHAVPAGWSLTVGRIVVEELLAALAILARREIAP